MSLGLSLDYYPHPSISRWRITVALIFIHEWHIITLSFIRKMNIYQGLLRLWNVL